MKLLLSTIIFILMSLSFMKLALATCGPECEGGSQYTKENCLACSGEGEDYNFECYNSTQQCSVAPGMQSNPTSYGPLYLQCFLDEKNPSPQPKMELPETDKHCISIKTCEDIGADQWIGKKCTFQNQCPATKSFSVHMSCG